MEEFEYEEIIMATQNFSSSTIVGKGSHGCVYRGTFKDNRVVAIKTPSLGLQILHDTSKLDNEIRVLSSLDHNPHVIKLIGLGKLGNKTLDFHDHDDAKSFLVMEFMPNGSLHHWLHLATAPPPWLKRVEVALHVARALKFLHEGSPQVIHRDIKSANVLFDSNWNAKLADFGLAVMDKSRFGLVNQPTRPAGTIGYLDPSYTTPSKLSTKIDVFSFGVLVLEIISGRKVIDVSKEPASIIDWAVSMIEKKRIMDICDTRIALPTSMEGMFRHLLCIATSCVSPNEAYRPSIDEIVKDLENISADRVRVPIWINPLRNIIFSRQRRKLARRCLVACSSMVKYGREHSVDDIHGDFPRRFMLREVLSLDENNP